MKGEGYMIEEILEVLEKFVSHDRYIKMAQYLHTIEEGCRIFRLFRR